MSKYSSRSTVARRTAEALLNKAQKREASVKLEQERDYEAMTLKIARLRELRLAKEAADKEKQTATPTPAPRPPKPRRSKQT
jgi:primosomal protein N''